MTKQEIYDQVNGLIFIQSGDLSRQEYGNLLDDIMEDCMAALNAMNEDEQETE